MIIIGERGYEINALIKGEIVQLECVRCTEERGKKFNKYQKFRVGRNTKGIYIRKGNKKVYIGEELKVFMQQFDYDKELFKKMRKESWI